MAGFLASMLLPSLLGIGGMPRAPTGRAQAMAGVRKKVLLDKMMAGGTGYVMPKRKRATAGKKKVSAKTLAALAKGRATAKRNRNRRKWPVQQKQSK